MTGKKHLMTATSEPDNETELPVVRELKTAMESGKIPLEVHFHQLIELAAEGAIAVGSLPAGAGPGPGLVLEDGCLAVHPEEGLSLSSDNLGVCAGTRQFVMPQGELGLIAGSGLNIGAGAPLGVKVADAGGLGLTAGQELQVKTAVQQGLSAANNGVAIKLHPQGGLSHTKEGVVIADVAPDILLKPDLPIEMAGDDISVAESTSMCFDEHGAAKIRLAGNNGIAESFLFDDSDDLTGSPGLGCAFSTDFSLSAGGMLNLSHPLAVGTIVMFSGDAVPPNWVLCDSTNGTPDLRHAFIEDGDQVMSDGTAKEVGSYRLVYIMLQAD